MRNLIIGATALLAGCATQASPPAAAAGADGPSDSIEVIFHPDQMFWSIEDGGEGRFKTGEKEDYTFPVSHEDYVRISALLEPYRADGLLCDDPEDTRERAGYLLWREQGVVTRRPHETLCYTDTYRVAERSLNRAYYDMQAMAEERGVLPPPPPPLPAPDRLTLTALYWGRVTEAWSVPRSGEGRWTKGDETRTFSVSEADFDRLRDIFRPYEGVRFECERVITDGPYGHVTWSQEGREDQQLNWDAGCVTGDAADVFQRWDQAEVMLKALRDGG